MKLCIFWLVCFFLGFSAKWFARAEVKHSIYFDWPKLFLWEKRVYALENKPCESWSILFTRGRPLNRMVFPICIISK